jgi:hypothetical protein
MLMTCASVQRRLQSFHDRELGVREMIAVEAHLTECPPCAKGFRELRTIGDALRVVAAPAPADDWAGVQPGVISRMRAEDQASWSARARRFIDDVHLVWIGLASAAATVVLAGSILSLIQTAPERDDSLAAYFAVLGARPGSDLNPATLDGRGLDLGPTKVMAPTVPQDGVVFASLASLPMQDDVVVPISLRVNREGWVDGVRMLDSSARASEVMELINEIAKGRLEPAQYGGNPVAVSLVWLLANTTVRPGKT